MKELIIAVLLCVLWRLFTRVANPLGCSLLGVSPSGLRTFKKINFPLRSQSDFDGFGIKKVLAFNDVFHSEFSFDKFVDDTLACPQLNTHKNNKIGESVLVVEDSERWGIEYNLYKEYLEDVSRILGDEYDYDQSHGAIASFLILAFEREQAIVIGAQLIDLLDKTDIVKVKNKIMDNQERVGDDKIVGMIKALTLGYIPLSISVILIAQAHKRSSFEIIWGYIEYLANKAPHLIVKNKRTLKSKDLENFYVLFASYVEATFEVTEPPRFDGSLWKTEELLSPEGDEECSMKNCDDFIDVVCDSHNVFVCEDHMRFHRHCITRNVAAQELSDDESHPVSILDEEKTGHQKTLAQKRENTVWAAMGNKVYDPRIELGAIKINPSVIGGVLNIQNSFPIGVIGTQFAISWNEDVLGLNINGIEHGKPIIFDHDFTAISHMARVPIETNGTSGFLEIWYLGLESLYPFVYADAIASKQVVLPVIECNTLFTMNLRTIQKGHDRASQIDLARSRTYDLLIDLLVAVNERIDGKTYACPECHKRVSGFDQMIRHVQSTHIGNRNKRFCLHCLQSCYEHNKCV